MHVAAKSRDRLPGNGERSGSRVRGGLCVERCWSGSRVRGGLCGGPCWPGIRLGIASVVLICGRSWTGSGGLRPRGWCVRPHSLAPSAPQLAPSAPQFGALSPTVWRPQPPRLTHSAPPVGRIQPRTVSGNRRRHIPTRTKQQGPVISTSPAPRPQNRANDLTANRTNSPRSGAKIRVRPRAIQ
jgi:hypothetical protein